MQANVKPSPVKALPGSITLPAHLNWPQVAAYAEATAAAEKILAEQHAAEDLWKAANYYPRYEGEKRQLHVFESESQAHDFAVANPDLKFKGEQAKPTYSTDAIDHRRFVSLSHTARSRLTWIKVYCQIIEDSNIEGVGKLTESNFPATPPNAAAELFQWVAREVGALFSESETVPNA